MGSNNVRRLNVDNINQHVREAKYAVRGELAVRSEEYRADLAGGLSKLPFAQVISANIGNPQQLDQKPLTFFRQVLSILENPGLLEKDDVLINHLGYKPDVLERAKKLLAAVGSVGAYSASNGAPAIRQSIANFLESKFLDSWGWDVTHTDYAHRARWIPCRPGQHLSLGWCLFGCQHPSPRHLCQRKVRHPRPHPSVPPLHCLSQFTKSRLRAVSLG